MTTATDPTTDPTPPVDPAPTDPTPPPAPTDPTPPTDPAADKDAEIAKWKEMARRHETQAKANKAAATELETLKKQSMTDQEKAVEAARQEARKEVLGEVGGKLAEAAIRVAGAGRNVDLDALLEGVDASKFLDDAGDPDTKAITAWMNRVAPKVDPTDPPPPGRRDLGQGPRGLPPKTTSDPLEDHLKSILGVE